MLISLSRKNCNILASGRLTQRMRFWARLALHPNIVVVAPFGALYNNNSSHTLRRSAEIAHRPPAPVPLPALFALPAEWRGGSRLPGLRSRASQPARDIAEQAAIRNISLQKLA